MMGELKFFLRLQIKQTPKGICIYQTKYVKELLKKFNMNDAKEIKTPMHPMTYLGLDEESTKVDGTRYRAMFGALLCPIAFRPNIMFSVCLCSRFQKEPREFHLTAVKLIIKYLIETSNLGLLFKRKERFKFTSLCDVDYAGGKVERKKHNWKLSLYWWKLSDVDMQEPRLNYIVHC